MKKTAYLSILSTLLLAFTIATFTSCDEGDAFDISKISFSAPATPALKAVSFSEVAGGGSGTFEITVVNNFSESVKLTGVAVENDPDGVFATDFTANVSLKSKASLKVLITFTPKEAKDYAGTDPKPSLTFTINGVEKEIMIAEAEGVDTLPDFDFNTNITFAPVDLQFADTEEGKSSLPSTISVTSSYGEDVTITAVNSNYDVVFTTNFDELTDVVISSGGEDVVEIEITFSPTEAKNYAIMEPAPSLTFTINGVEKEILITEAEGVDVEPVFDINTDIAFDPVDLKFPFTVFTETPSTVDLSIANSFREDMILSNVTASDDVFTTSFASEVIISSGESINVDVTFSPTEAKDYAATDPKPSLTFTIDGVEKEIMIAEAKGVDVLPDFDINTDIAFVPTAVAFDETEKGESSTSIIGVTSSYGREVTITSVVSNNDAFITDFDGSTGGAVMSYSVAEEIKITFSPIEVIDYAIMDPAPSLTFTINGVEKQITITSAMGINPPVFDVNNDIDLSLADLAFGEVEVGSDSEAKDITITNNFRESVNLDNIDFPDINSFSIRLADGSDIPYPHMIASNSSVMLSATFSPSELVNYLGGGISLSFSVGGVQGTRTITITSAMGVAAAFDVSTDIVINPGSIQFLDTEVNKTSLPQPITIINNFREAVTISNLIVSDGFNARLIENNAEVNSINLGVNAGYPLVVSFTPTVEKSYAGGKVEIRFTLNNVLQGIRTIDITSAMGVATLPDFDVSTDISINPESIQFLDTEVNRNSLPQPITITNNFREAVTINNISSSDGFYANFPDNLLPYIIQAYVEFEVGQLGVFFAPIEAKSYAGGSVNLSFSVGGVDQGTRTISITSAMGVAATFDANIDIGIEPILIRFLDTEVNKASPPQYIAITNNFREEVKITIAAISDGFSASLPNNPPPYIIQANGGVVQLSVSFTPTEAKSYAGGSVSLSFSVGGVDQGGRSISITAAMGVAAFSLDDVVISGRLEFGGVEINTSSEAKTVTITNNFREDVTMSSVSTSSEFSATLPDGQVFPYVLAPGGSVMLSVVFTPPEAKSYAGGGVSLSFSVGSVDQGTKMWRITSAMGVAAP